MNRTKSEALSQVPLTGSSPGRLLIVDDDLEFLSPLCEFLSAAGYEVTGCASGREALEAMNERNFDLLLTDLMMPEMDGIALLQTAQERDPRLVSIVITGQGSIQTAVDAMKVGAFDYLVKPLELRMLDQVLTRALDIRRIRMENQELREAVEVYRLKQALRQSENFYRSIFENTGTAMMIVEEDTTISLVNTEFERLSGYTKKEVEGKIQWKDVITVGHDDLLRLETFHRQRRADPTSAPKNYEVHLMDRNGEAREILLMVDIIAGTRKSVASLLDITERKKTEEKIHGYQKALRSLALALSLTEERERRSIATDLHDGIGQTLALSKIKLEVLSESLSGDVRAEAVNEIRELIGQSIQYTRSLTSELSPSVLYELGFGAAVETLGEQMQKKHGIHILVKNDEKPKSVDEEVGVILYKAVRELIVNVVKHAHAHRIDIWVQRSNDGVRITLRDDGIGFSVPVNEEYGKSAEFGFGLFNIRERLESIGGGFEIESWPGQGSCVTIMAPFKRQAAGEKAHER